MWNTLLPLPGLLAAPVTLTAGVLASHTLLAVLAFAGSATAMWWVAGRWAPWGPARFAAGLLYGFSPYLVAQGTGHLNLSLVALPPLVLLLLDDLLVRQDRSPVRRGLLLGLVALAQLLTTEEVLASTFVVCALGLLVLLVQQQRPAGRVRHALDRPRDGRAGPDRARGVPAGRAVRRAAAGHRAGAGRLAVRRRPARHRRPDHLPAARHRRHPRLGRQRLGERQLPRARRCCCCWSCSPSGTARVPVVRFAAALGVVAWVLSLGERLHVAGDGDLRVPLPFALLAHVPVLQNMAAVRFSLYVVLCAALVLAVGLDRLHAAGSLRRLPTSLVAARLPRPAAAGLALLLRRGGRPGLLHRRRRPAGAGGERGAHLPGPAVPGERADAVAGRGRVPLPLARRLRHHAAGVRRRHLPRQRRPTSSGCSPTSAGARRCRAAPCWTSGCWPTSPATTSRACWWRRRRRARARSSAT